MPRVNAVEDAEQLGRMPVAKQLTYGYYRQPNGWITVSPATDLEELSYRREGWEPLKQYGRVEMASQYMADHPLEPLFMRGGAGELPIDQVIGMGLHLNPPAIPSCGRVLDQNHKRHFPTCWQNPITVIFPQMEGIEVSAFECRFCERPPFPTEKARDQHEGVMHQDEKSDIRTGETLADALVTGLKSEPREAGRRSTLPFICGLCGEGFKHHVKLAGHVKSHREETVVPNDAKEEKNGV